MTARHEITRADILPVAEYAGERPRHRRAITDIKKWRRVEVGPFATFYFENYDTMWHQIHEMLYIEKGGEEQIAGELTAYNPLIPKGSELVATVMFEIDDAARRARELARLGGVEETMSLSVDGETIAGVAETDTDRTDAAGKASSVQFIHFPFTAGQIAKFKAPDAQIIIAIGHPHYGHMAIVSEPVRASLAADFD